METMIRGSGGINVSPVERWASLLAGASLLIRGLRGNSRGWLKTILGADLIRRGATGHSYVYQTLSLSTTPRDGSRRATIPYRQGIRVDEAVTINKPARELYDYWRGFENLPRFMRHLVSVSQADRTRSHWVAKGPGGKTIDWDAEIINDIPGELIGWRSEPGSLVSSAGSVQFKELPAGRGTVVNVELQYDPPGGLLTVLAAKLLGEEPEQQVREDLRRFKQIMEAGEIPITGVPAEAPPRARSVRKQPGRVEGDFPAESAAL